jgi:predicted site-specific integrase-resolvase
MNITPTPTLSLSDLLNPEQTADLIKIKKDTLAIWRTTGRYNLKFVKVGRRIFYRRSDIQDWLESRTQTQTA